MAQKHDWSIIPNNMQVTDVNPEEHHSFDLYNLSEQQALCYGERPWGINLKWTDPAKADNIRFVRQGGTGPIKYDEPIGIHVRGGGFLVYQSRRQGINLSWANSPRYEWLIKSDKNAAGTPVRAGTVLGLYSTVENDFVMYEPRDWGINLKWLKDSGKYQSLNEVINVAKSAKDLYEKMKDLV